MDNSKKRGSPDSDRISTQPHEIEYWKNKWHISWQQLAWAKKATWSTSVKKVEKYLKDNELI